MKMLPFGNEMKFIFYALMLGVIVSYVSGFNEGKLFWGDVGISYSC